MSRMTRSRIKQEAIEEQHQSTPAMPITNGTASRAVSITSRPTPTPDLHHDPLPSTTNATPTSQQQQLHSSGDTTVPDTDTDMAGTERSGTIDAAVDNDGVHGLAQHSRQLIRGIQKLEALNIDATLPSLPKFIVVGDQSTGKSSIVEAICDITVPRDQGTCTRCPFQITTTAAQGLHRGWSCHITLHSRYMYDPHARAGRDPSKLDRWTEQNLNIYDFTTVTDKSQLEDALRRAQKAILNPGRNPNDYRNATYNDRIEVGFSPNIVNLEVQGEGLPELSFFDMPGAINVEGDGDDYLVELVEKLIRSYLRQPNTLILLTCAADQDIENSTSFRYVKQSNALDRCLGVLTKPDLVGPQRVHLIKKVLAGQRFVLGGPDAWFVTRQLSQEDLERGYGRAQARMLENDFFGKGSWNTELAYYSPRFGTANLQFAVSQKLTEQILQDLPQILARVESRLSDVDAELQGFPDKPRSAAITVMNVCDVIARSFEAHLGGEDTQAAFRTHYRKAIKNAQIQLHGLRPSLNLNTPNYKRPSIALDTEDSDSAGDETPSKKRRRDDEGRPIFSTPARSTPFRPKPTPTPRSGYVKAESNFESSTNRLMVRLDEVRELYENRNPCGLSGQLNPKVTDDLVRLSLKPWRAVVTSLMAEIKDTVLDMLLECVATALATRRRTQLFAKATQVVEHMFEGLMTGVHERVGNTISGELNRPITYQAIKTLAEPIKTKLMQDRFTIRVNEYFDTMESKGHKVPQGAVERMKKKVDLENGPLKTDGWGGELDAMTTPLAYYDVASARMLDTIAVQLDYNLLHNLQTNLLDTLRNQLRVTDEEYCVALIAEDPAREAQRARLESEKVKLCAALEELRNLPGQAGF